MDRDRRPDDRRRTGAVVGMLLLASLTVITLDARPSGDSPVDPLRAGTSAVLGPMESGLSTVTAPVAAIPRYFGDVSALRERTDELEAENARLRSRLHTGDNSRNRVRELDRLLGISERGELSMVPARVVSFGPAQSFSRTATIDAGTRDGVRNDMTVVNGQGLVGRVLTAGRDTSTVLLVVDAKSVVGGRLGRSQELGFLTGDGRIGDDGRLSLELVDAVAKPRTGDTVVTWGSENDAPYVAGVPIGEVTQVRSSPRQLSQTAVVRPYVDFSSLDLVGVVVGTGQAKVEQRTIRAGSEVAGGPQ